MVQKQSNTTNANTILVDVYYY